MSLVNLLAGMAQGYVQGKDRAYQQDRQKQQDDWLTEQRARQRSQWAEEDAIKKGLKDAAAPATISTTQYQPADAKSDLGGGGVAPAMQNLYKVRDQSYADEAQAKGAMEKYNDTTTTARRMAGVYQQRGQLDKALSMQNAIAQKELTDLGLDKARKEHFDSLFNDKISSAFSAGGDWTAIAAKMLTDTEVGGFKGVNVRPIPSADGKRIEFVGTGPNGETGVLKSYTNDDQGRAGFMADVMRAPLRDKIGYLHERARSAQAAADKDRDFDLREKQFKSEETYRKGMLGLQSQRLAISGSRGGGGGGGGSGGGGRGGLDMTAVDKQLIGMYTKEDPATGAKGLDANAMHDVRSLVPMMPAAAQGDSMGAVLQAQMLYQKYGGDMGKIAQAQAAMQGQGAAPSAGQPVPAAQPPKSDQNGGVVLAPGAMERYIEGLRKRNAPGDAEEIAKVQAAMRGQGRAATARQPAAQTSAADAAMQAYAQREAALRSGREK
jgi:hypothetical protein